MKTFQVLIGAMLLTAATVLAVTNTTNRANGRSTTMNVPSTVLHKPSGVITNMPSGVIHKPSGVLHKPSGVITNAPSTVIQNPPDDFIGDLNQTNQPAQPAE